MLAASAHSSTDADLRYSPREVLSTQQQQPLMKHGTSIDFLFVEPFADLWELFTVFQSSAVASRLIDSHTEFRQQCKNMLSKQAYLTVNILQTPLCL